MIHDAADRRSTSGGRRSFAWLLTLPTVLFVIAAWFDLTPWLRGPDEWRWSLRPFTSPERLIVPVVALGLYALICAKWLSAFDENAPTRKAPWRFLLFLTLAAPLIQLALAFAVSRYPLLEFFGPTVSVHTSGYFTTAISTPNLNGLLAQYPSAMPELPIHAQSHPPGPIVLQWLGWRFFQALPALADAIAMPLRMLQCHNPGLMALDNSQIASASVGMLIPLIGALAVWPIFAFGRKVACPKAGAIAAALFPVMPLFAMWPAQWDQVYPLLLFAGLYLAHTGLESRSLRRIFLAGVPLSIATFFSVGNAVLIVIVGLYGLVWSVKECRLTLKSAGAESALPSAIVFALGCASIWIAYGLLYGVNPLDVISTGSHLAFESTTGNRSYLLWLLWDPIDFAIFLGVPIVVLTFINLVKPRHLPRRLWALTIATFGTFVLLDLSGIVRGEVGRLWMYFGPLFVLIVAANTADQQAAHVSRFTFHSSLLFLLSLQLLTLNTRWLVNDSFLNAPPDRSANFTAPAPQIDVQASFDHQIALRGYAATLSQGWLSLTLYWQALTQPLHADTVFVHVLDANGRQVGQQDNMPVHDQLPTSCWQPGEFVTDPYTISVSAEARAPLSLEVGLYQTGTHNRLSLDDGSGTAVALKVP